MQAGGLIPVFDTSTSPLVEKIFNLDHHIFIVYVTI